MRPPVYRRGEVWWCRVASPSGGRAQRVSTRCRDYQAAVDVWRQLERASVADPDRTAHSTALADALDRRLDERRAVGRRPATLSMLEQKARHLVRVLGGDTPLARIDARAVDRYVETRLAEGAARATVGQEGMRLKPRS